MPEALLTRQILARILRARKTSVVVRIQGATVVEEAMKEEDLIVLEIREWTLAVILIFRISTLNG